jgi:hypothetical protein
VRTFEILILATLFLRFETTTKWGLPLGATYNSRPRERYFQPGVIDCADQRISASIIQSLGCCDLLCRRCVEESRAGPVRSVGGQPCYLVREAKGRDMIPYRASRNKRAGPTSASLRRAKLDRPCYLVREAKGVHMITQKEKNRTGRGIRRVWPVLLSQQGQPASVAY